MSFDPAQPAVRVENISKCYQIYARPQDRLKQTLFRGRKTFYNEFWALRDINLEVARGETVGIVGRNGSGKSTLLQIICGTLAPTSGQVQTAGRIAALLELGAGFHPEFTGRENVYLNARIMGLTQQETDARFDQIAAFADIGPFIDQPVKTYSSGMYVRLAFSVIANVDADILIIDEALAVGDVFFTQKCMRFLRGFKERGTIIFVSHDSAAVVNLCDRALWIHHGQARRVGTAKDVFESYLAEHHTQLSALDNKSSTPTPATSPAAAPAQTSATFGAGGAVIESTQLLDAHGQPLFVVKGGEQATVRITARIVRPLTQVMMGFFIKDRLGQNLFGQNTGEAQAHFAAQPGQHVTASFSFEMPTLRAGNYTISPAIADGTQASHVQQHWIHDACAFRSIASGESTGLVGIPMHNISLAADHPATVGGAA